MTDRCAMSAEESWSAYCDGNMPPSLREEKRLHLSACPDCREVVKALQNVIARAASSPGIQPPQAVWDGIKSRVNCVEGSTPHGHRGTAPLRFRPHASWGIFAAAASVLLVFGVSRMHRDDERPSAATAIADQGATQALQRSLATLDSAIIQVQVELEREPGNPQLMRMLEAVRADRVASLASATSVLDRPNAQ